MQQNTIKIYKTYGIYGIKNKLNDKIYIGKTMQSFGDRWNCHKGMLRGGYHENPYLQNAWNKYGEQNFEFIVIKNLTGSPVEEVNEAEIELIKYYKDLGLSYNIHNGGDGGLFLGRHLSDEAKRKIGEKNRVHMLGRKVSEKTKEKMSKSQKERYKHMTAEERKNWSRLMSEKASGYKISEDKKKHLYGNKHGAKYTIEDVRNIRKLYEKENKSYSEISKLVNIPRHTVYQIATYRRWKGVV